MGSSKYIQYLKYQHTDLKKFGLNPLHWLLVEWHGASVNQALFINIDDPELKITAKLKKTLILNSTLFRIEELHFAI